MLSKNLGENFSISAVDIFNLLKGEKYIDLIICKKSRLVFRSVIIVLEISIRLDLTVIPFMETVSIFPHRGHSSRTEIRYPLQAATSNIAYWGGEKMSLLMDQSRKGGGTGFST